MANKKNRYQFIEAVTLPGGDRIAKGDLVQQETTGGVGRVLRFTSQNTVLLDIPVLTGGSFVAHAEIEFLKVYQLPEEVILEHHGGSKATKGDANEECDARVDSEEGS